SKAHGWFLQNAGILTHFTSARACHPEVDTMKEHPLATLGGLGPRGASVGASASHAGIPGRFRRPLGDAWSSSQQTLNDRPLANTTVRLIARVAVAGEAVRLRLDNGFGTSPLTIGRTFVGARARAPSSSGAPIDRCSSVARHRSRFPLAARRKRLGDFLCRRVAGPCREPLCARRRRASEGG